MVENNQPKEDGRRHGYEQFDHPTGYRIAIAHLSESQFIGDDH